MRKTTFFAAAGAFALLAVAMPFNAAGEC